MLLTLLWLAVITAAISLYFRQLYSFFSSRGVKTLRPVPVLGNMGRIVLKMEHFADHINRCYFTFPEERFVGRYEFIKPMLIIRDIELIKKIAVKDFDYFIDHRTIIDESTDPLFGRNLFSLKGQEWKDMRSTLSPAFTSSKIRVMVPFMVDVGDQMIKSLKLKIQESNNGYIDVDVKDLTTRYANDVIASCAFGLKVDSLTDVDNQFYAMGKATSTFKFKQILMFFGFASLPKVMKALKVSLFSDESKAFFRDLVMSTMQNREEKNIIRPDMIHLLMEAKKGQLTHDEKVSQDVDAGFATVEESSIGKNNINRVWKDDDLIAQAILFFIAGFETVSSGMSFLLHELAMNPDVQERLVQEIRENDAKNGGKFDYTSIQQMTYMDMVVSELLRLWPPVIALDRVCIKDYNCGKPNSKATEDFILRKGTGVGIPTWAFHHDPEFFPDPFKFDPERFSEENKHKINPFAYSPFGLGPRNCIGSRFALCEIKVMAYQLLQHLEVSPAEKTCIPAQLSRDTFNIKLKGGHWVRFKARNLRKGSGVAIPTWAFHHDPEHFPDPYKFDPERFSEENKHKINPFVYTPFGLGPRNCIGSRFALCEIKVMAYQLLQNLELSPAEKTCIASQLCRGTFNIKLKGGHWVRLKIREKNQT